jgi:hypothetical protein
VNVKCPWGIKNPMDLLSKAWERRMHLVLCPTFEPKEKEK